MNKNKVALYIRATKRGLFQRASPPFVAQIDVITIITIFVFFSPGTGERELLNQICRVAAETKGFQDTRWRWRGFLFWRGALRGLAAMFVFGRQEQKVNLSDLIVGPREALWEDAEQHISRNQPPDAHTTHKTSERHYGKCCNWIKKPFTLRETFNSSPSGGNRPSDVWYSSDCYTLFTVYCLPVSHPLLRNPRGRM